jgi:HEPN domain-containing protein
LSTELLIASHLRLALESVDALRLLLQSGNHYAAYTAEQCVEHLVYALAQSEGVHFPRNQQHQLHTMAGLLPEENSYRAGLLELGWLEAYATSYRYPKTKGAIAEGPSRAKLEAVAEKTSAILEELAEHFVVDLTAVTQTPAKNKEPPRGTSWTYGQ